MWGAELFKNGPENSLQFSQTKSSYLPGCGATVDLSYPSAGGLFYLAEGLQFSMGRKISRKAWSLQSPFDNFHFYFPNKSYSLTISCDTVEFTLTLFLSSAVCVLTQCYYFTSLSHAAMEEINLKFYPAQIQRKCKMQHCSHNYVQVECKKA